MNEVYIKKEDLNSWIVRHLPQNKDFYSIDDLICAIEDMDSDINRLESELEDLEQQLEDNYIPRKRSDYTGDSYDDRF